MSAAKCIKIAAWCYVYRPKQKFRKRPCSWSISAQVTYQRGSSVVRRKGFLGFWIWVRYTTEFVKKIDYLHLHMSVRLISQRIYFRVINISLLTKFVEETLTDFLGDEICCTAVDWNELAAWEPTQWPPCKLYSNTSSVYLNRQTHKISLFKKSPKGWPLLALREKLLNSGIRVTKLFCQHRNEGGFPFYPPFL